MIAGYIYRITNTVNGKVYIGQTSVSIAQRCCHHRWASKKDSTHPLYRAFKKYGSDKFSIECLETVIGSNPVWLAGNAEALAKGRAVQATKALERDAQCSPEEALRRVRRREANRRSRSKKVVRPEDS